MSTGTALQNTLDAALNKLAKWRNVLASWQLGTRPANDGECNAVKDHREATLFHRAELNAMLKLLLDKQVITHDEFNRCLLEEVKELDVAHERMFPGFKTTEFGLDLAMPIAAETMRIRNFPK
jgi:hypothetical protein